MGLFDRFEVVYEQTGDTHIKILRDTKTGVRYLLVMNANGPAAITPLLGLDGQPAAR